MEEIMDTLRIVKKEKLMNTLEKHYLYWALLWIYMAENLNQL